MAKTRRPRGTGSYDKIIDKKGNALYRWRIGIYDSINQKTAYKSIKAKSQAELEEKVTAWKEENADFGNVPSLPQRLTVERWVEIWLHSIQGKLSAGSVYRYKGTINRHLLPNFGNRWINQLRPLDFQMYFDGLLKEMTPSTIKTLRAHFCVCFEAAVRLGVISKNPVRRIIVPKVQRPELKILEDDEVNRLLTVAKKGDYLPPTRTDSDDFMRKRNYLIVLLAVASGMREGEILGLTWPCVDESSAKIVVKHSLQILPHARGLKSPKNGKTRIVVIPEYVAHEINEWRKFQADYAERYKGLYKNPDSLVFTKPQGGFVTAAHFYEWDFRFMLSQAKLLGTRFHDLRHYFASSALARGVSVMAVSEQLGHSSINFTFERYVHVLQKSRDEMKEMLDANPLFKAAEAVGEGREQEKTG